MKMSTIIYVLVILLFGSPLMANEGSNTSSSVDQEREREYDMGATSLIGDSGASLLYDIDDEVSYVRSITEGVGGRSLLGNDIDEEQLDNE